MDRDGGVVFLKEPPQSFQGWVDVEVVPEAELAVKYMLSKGFVGGGLGAMAEALRERCGRPLGELRAVLRQLLERGLLCYVGEELRASDTLQEELQSMQKPCTPEQKQLRQVHEFVLASRGW